MNNERWKAAWVCEECGHYHYGAGFANKFFRPEFCKGCGSTLRKFKYTIWRWKTIRNPDYKWYKPWTWVNEYVKETK